MKIADIPARRATTPAGLRRRLRGDLESDAGEVRVERNRGLVTLGPAMASEAFEIPQNVVTAGCVPHSQVFPHADAVITHAGHGTVMRALAHGLPLVCLPMGRDQNDNAVHVSSHGVGIGLRPSARSKTIRDAVQRVLTEPAFRTNARSLQRAILDDAASNRAVEELDCLEGAPVRHPVLAG